LWKVPVDLIAQLIAEAPDFLLQVAVGSRNLANPNNEGMINARPAKAVAIGVQGVGQHEGVSSIILGTGNRMSIAEAVELLRRDEENGEATFDQSLDQRPAWHLDADRDLFWLDARLQQ
jgi:hypothetical protein